MLGLPSCRDVSEHLSEACEHPLGWRRRLGVRLHLLVCAACRRYARQLEWLEGVLRRMSREARATRLDPQAAERIRDRLRDAERDGKSE